MKDNKIVDGKEMMSESKFYMGYSRWNDSEGGFETWGGAVDRVVNMHKEKYKAKKNQINK